MDQHLLFFPVMKINQQFHFLLKVSFNQFYIVFLMLVHELR